MCKIEQEAKKVAAMDCVKGFAAENNLDATRVAKVVIGKGLKPNEQRAMVNQMGGSGKVSALQQSMRLVQG